MNTRHLILTVAFGIGILEPATVRAQESVVAPTSITAKLRSTAPYPNNALRQSGVLSRSTASERLPANDEPGLVRRGQLVEAFLQWTERLVTELDPFDVLETPFQPVPSIDGAAPPSPIVEQQWKPIPRLRPVQLPGGYGLVARITF